MSIENEALRLMVSELNAAIIGAKWERDETLRELRASPKDGKRND